IVFASAASNLVAGDTNDNQDVFLFDQRTRHLSLISRASNGTQGNSHTYSAAISPDGRYVALVSYATNLVAGDTNGRQDVFIRDLRSATTTLASIGYQGAPGNGDSVGAMITSRGRYVVFESTASNLTQVDRNSNIDVFIRTLR
ncbi:MAG TPA: hypothetical protein VFC19_06725, partial [Candidatus Limnocylindrales bacterium]|nr:hypothetical protein [Candidatus Limnocylindrales bacterium]